MQITIEFHPTILGDLQGELSINYDTGEIIHVALSGVGINLDVRLDKSELQIVPTYIGMANFKNFAINNKGNEIVKFQFSRFATEFEEQKGIGFNLCSTYNFICATTNLGSEIAPVLVALIVLLVPRH